MSEYRAIVEWQRNGAVFTDSKYSRGHRWLFDGGIEVPASSSPHSVRLPFSVEDAVDPEEAFVAALSSCHMLTFLYLAAKKKFVVESYRDDAVGFMEKNEQGRLAITRVTLRPEIILLDAAFPCGTQAATQLSIALPQASVVVLAVVSYRRAPP